MDNNEFAGALRKVAEELREVSATLKKQAAAEAQEKTAAQALGKQDLSFGEIGGRQPSVDPLTDFCFS
jgi:hypothetical protein